MVELQPSKLAVWVRFPSPAFSCVLDLPGRGKVDVFGCRVAFAGGLERVAAVAQSVERVLGKDEVKGSSPFSSFPPGEQ